jgi:beta-glucanase (GH16 family)
LNYRPSFYFLLVPGFFLFWGAGVPKAYAVPAGYSLYWSDEFNGAVGSAPNGANWTYNTGDSGWGNAELENYTNSTQNSQIVADPNATDGKSLAIIALDTMPGSANYGTVGRYTSARLLSNAAGFPGVTFQYGYMEARVQMPYGDGIWPAFWMLGTNINSGVAWPNCGETDIMENIGNAADQPVNHGSLHAPNWNPTGTYTLPGGALYHNGYHTFGVLWQANQISFYVDDTLYETQTSTDATGAGGTWEFNSTMFFLLNMAVGGNYPGSPDASTSFPQTMLVDYVRVYEPNTPTATPNASATSTFSFTPTATPSLTSTLTATSTPTRTNSATASTTPTSSPTKTPSPTVTSTATATVSSTASRTLTATPSSTTSWTPTAFLTATGTASLTATASPTTTQTNSPTASPTRSMTPSPTDTGTAIASLTATLSPTPTSSTTPSATASLTLTATPTNSATSLLLATPTFTPSATSTFIPASTASWTPTPSGPSEISIYPNPVFGPTVNVLPPAYSGLSDVRVEIFTTAFRKVQDEAFPNLPPDTAIEVQLKDNWGKPLADGLYYLVVLVDGGRSIGKLMVLR